MLIDKENKDYKINSRNVRSIIILSTFAILLLYLSSAFLFENIKQVWADSVIATVPTGTTPLDLAYNSFNNDIYVGNANSNTVSVISPSNTVVATVPVGGGPENLAYNSFNHEMYVANEDSGSVTAINPDNTVAATIPVGSFPFAIAYNPNNNDMYVGNSESNSVSVISPSNTVVATVPVGAVPDAIAYNPNNNDMYVGNRNDNSVTVINSANTVAATIPAGGFPGYITYNPNNNDMYVADQTSNSVTVINSANTVVATIPVGSVPGIIAYNSFNNEMYVTNTVSNTVTAINPDNTVAATIPVGGGPFGIAYNPNNHNIYVGNSNGNTVSVISPSNIVAATIPVGAFPFSVANNPSNNDMYVTNANSASVSVIGTPIPPTHTTITSATDGTGNLVLNKSSTVSTSITFNVQATPGTNQITGFQCKLDNAPSFTSCGSPATNNAGTITLSGLTSNQQHTIQIIAVDSQNNVDSTPAEFIWTILTPGQGIQNITNTINGMNLPNGLTTSLESNLNNVLKQINNNNIKPACNNLNAFISKVKEDQTSGQLTPQQSAELIKQATNVQKAIGCLTSSSGPASSSNTINNSVKPFNDPMNGLTAGSG